MTEKHHDYTRENQRDLAQRKQNLCDLKKKRRRIEWGFKFYAGFVLSSTVVMAIYFAAKLILSAR